MINENEFEVLVCLEKEKRNISQREVAKILHVGKSTYARWETGEQVIPLNHLNDFCKYFKVTMDYVLNLSNQNNFNNKITSNSNSQNECDETIIMLEKMVKALQKEICEIKNNMN